MDGGMIYMISDDERRWMKMMDDDGRWRGMMDGGRKRRRRSRDINKNKMAFTGKFYANAFRSEIKFGYTLSELGTSQGIQRYDVYGSPRDRAAFIHRKLASGQNICGKCH